KIERINVRGIFSEYVMKYYPHVRSLKSNLEPYEYELYKELVRAYNNNFYSYNYSKILPIDFTRSVISSVSHKFSKEKEFLLDALDGCSNYGSNIFFEISPRNVCTDNGKLILIDVFFSRG